jgi:hypothetical protein
MLHNAAKGKVTMKSEYNRQSETRTQLAMPKFLLYGIFAVLFTAMTARSASAWTWSPFVTVYNGPGLCVQSQAGIDHRMPGVFSGNLAYAYTHALSEGCGVGLNKPDGSAAVRLEVYKWTGSSWAICQGTDWKYGATGTTQFGPWGPEEGFDYGGVASCGPGYYGTLAYSYIWDGSGWRGGSAWSGYEFVQ